MTGKRTARRSTVERRAAAPPGPAACCARRRRAFTLVELVAVIVVATILAGVAVPAIASIDGTRAGLAARRLHADVTFARQRALATGIRHWVAFDAAAETWSVLAEDPAAPGRAGATIVDDPGTGRPFTQALDVEPFHGVTIDAVSIDGGDEIGFDWIGRPLGESETDLAATGTVTLSSGAGIAIEVETGHVAPTP